jgi:hypothetical protein
MKVTEEKLFGFLPGDWRAEDGRGHVGTGFTSELAQSALKEAQAEDRQWADHRGFLFGLTDTSGPKNKR